MAVEHVDIDDPNIHEPKGASAASVDTVYVSNGAGSGTWTFAKLQGQTAAADNTIPVKSGSGIIFKTVPSTSPSFAEMDSATTTRNLVLSTPITVNNFSFNDFTAGKFSIDTNTSLNVLESGFYLLNWWGFISPTTNLGAANEIVNTKVRVNATAPFYRNFDITILRDLVAGNPVDFSGNRIVELAANDVVDMTMEALTATRSYNIQAHISLIKIANLT